MPTASGSGNRVLVRLDGAALTGKVRIGMRSGSVRLAPFISCEVRAAEIVEDTRLNVGRFMRLP